MLAWWKLIDMRSTLDYLPSRANQRHFLCIKERTWKKLHGSKERFLSWAGKEDMIKSVIQAIPTYNMSIFHIPEGIVAEINSMIARFWWGLENGNQKNTLV